jgi:hypothetical protein
MAGPIAVGNACGKACLVPVIGAMMPLLTFVAVRRARRRDASGTARK